MSFQPPAPTYLGPAAHTSTGNNKPINRIVLHGTVSPCVAGGARTTAAYFRSPSAGGSAHYVVDPVEAVQVVYDGVIAWHAPPNPNSLGVEMCDPVGDAQGKPLPLSRWKDADHQKMLKLAARLVAELCLAYDVPVVLLSPADLKAGKRGICEHSDVSEAFHQSTHWDLGLFPRRAFLRMVQAEVAALTAPAPVAVPVAPKITRIDKARDLLVAAMRQSKNKYRDNRIEACIKQLPEH